MFSCESSVFWWWNLVLFLNNRMVDWVESRLSLSLVKSRLSHRLEPLFNLCGNKIKTVWNQLFLFSQARWSKVAYFLTWSEIITAANVWTVMSNVGLVQMSKRYLIRSGPNAIQLPKLDNGTTHISDAGSFCQILNVVYQIHSRNARTTESVNFMLFNFWNNCLFVEVHNNEIFYCLTSNSGF